MDRAFHAYGPADTGYDLLDRLRTGDADFVQDAGWLQPYTFLWSALYCGGRITPATYLGLRFLAPAVAADDFGGPDPSLRWAVLWWIRDVARAVLDLGDDRSVAAHRDEPVVHAWLDEHLRQQRSIFDWDAGDEPGRVLLAAARVDCHDYLPATYRLVSPLLATDAPERLRSAAAGAAAALVSHPDLRGHRDQVIAFHRDEATAGTSVHRAGMLLDLGELGGSTRDWLTDPHLGVRVCAALSPGLATDPQATAVLRAADPDALDHAFGDMFLHQHARLSQVVAEALTDPRRPMTTSGPTRPACGTPPRPGPGPGRPRRCPG
ncbi:hypothetical protein [Actinoplanes sp. G11-F43]|uniref:hypothetical protein n=1 Tax=Actinoplanes sp. G11-F43 TaxID=3424130 RepID=UPI003D32962C